MSALAQPLATVDEYFALETASAVRHEYYRGHVIAMAGGSFFHGVIIGNVTRELGNRLLEGPCRVIPTEVRLAAEFDAHYTYPDVQVVCGKPVYQIGRPHTITNPVVLVEVLSPSTERADRGRKFADYRKLTSLREYMMVSQFEPKVELFRRGADGVWILLEFSGLDALVSLESLGIAVPLAEIYRKIEFEPEPVEVPES